MEKIKRILEKLARLRPRGFWPGFLAGIIYFSYIFRWIWPLYALDSFGIGLGPTYFSLIFLFFLVSVAGMAFFWGLFSFLLFRLGRNLNLSLVPMLAGGIFVICEYLRSWGYGILLMGNGSILGSHWTLGSPAYFFSNWEFILRTASLWGIYGIDFFLILILSSSVLLLTNRKSRRSILYSLSIISILFVIASVFATPANKMASSKTIPVAIIQTEKPTRVSSFEAALEDYIKKVEMLKNAAKMVPGGVIVFPEESGISTVLSRFLDNASIKDFFAKLSDNGVSIVDGNLLPGPDGLRSRTLFIDSKEGASGFYDKQLLTPVGEYLPYFLSLFTLGMDLPHNDGLKAGKDASLFNLESTRIKTVVCSDIISPGISSRGQYDLLISLQSLGIFGKDSSVASSFLSILKFRAVENHKYAVLASNYGRSYVINGSGKIEKSTDSPGYQILTADVVPNEERTWYNKLGDLPILLLSLAIFGTGFVFTKPSILDLFYKLGLRFKKLIE